MTSTDSLGPARAPRLRWLVLLVAAALMATACATSPAPDAAAPAGGAAGGAFPVSIPHKFGSTEITAEPQRVVAVGLLEQDALLALGVVPVATTEWFGGYPGAIHPWAQDALGSAAPPEVLSNTDGIQFERIAALQPDLIVAMYSGLDQGQYDTLAQIAPTIAQPTEYVNYGVPWQDVTRTVGAAVGRGAQADQLVADVEGQISAAAAAHPEFAGRTALMVTPFEGYYAYGPEDLRSRFLTALGFQVPAAIGDLAGEEFGASISRERLDLLDTDVLIWIVEGDVGRASVQSDPLYASFDVVKQGRDIFVNDTAETELYGATSFQTVLSIPLLLEQLVPRMSAAVDGDPATPAGA